MKKGYWVVAYKSISDESATKAYAELAGPALESFGGRFLTRTSSKVHPQEAGLQQRGLQKGASGTRLRRGTRLPHRRRCLVRLRSFAGVADPQIVRTGVGGLRGLAFGPHGPG